MDLRKCVCAHFIYLTYLELVWLSWATVPCLYPPAHTFKNIRGLEVKIPTKITAIVFQSWLDINFYEVRKIEENMFGLIQPIGWPEFRRHNFRPLTGSIDFSPIDLSNFRL